MIAMIALCIFGSSNLHSSILDKEKIYEVVDYGYSICCCFFPSILFLDLSNQNLDSLDGIDQLLVGYDNQIYPITSVKKLVINAQNNDIWYLPREITLLNLLSIDLRGNKNLFVNKYVEQNLKNCKFYYSAKNE